MKIRLASALLASAIALSGASAVAKDYTIDGRHTLVEFKIERLGFSKTIGWFRDISGNVSFDPEAADAASANITIKTDSIDTNFAPRDEWLRSDKVLNAAANPEITFVTTGIEVTGENTGTVTGDFTLNGVTKPVALDVTFNKIGMNPIDKVETIGFSATGSIKRSDYGVEAFLGPLGDDMTIEIQLEAALPKSE